MSNQILNYQESFNSIIEIVKKNNNVLGVTAFGSMLTGDIWDNSDIDLFVIVKDKINELKDVYGRAKDIQVHMKLLSKEEFLDFHKSNIGGDTLHRKLISSKLIYSNDTDVTDQYNKSKYYSDLDRERWTLVYLSNLLGDINDCKKYIHNNKFYIVFSSVVKAIDSYSKLYLNFNGYLLSKCPLAMVVSLDDEFKNLVDDLKESTNEESTIRLLEYMKQFIDDNLKDSCKILTSYLECQEKPLSSGEIKQDIIFKGFKIDMEEILAELEKNGLIYRSLRSYKLENKRRLIDENVYSSRPI